MNEQDIFEYSVFDFYKVIRRNFLFILLVSFLTTSLAATYSLLVQPIFSSSALLIPNQSQQDNTSAASSLIANFSGGFAESASNSEIAFQKLMSRDFFKEIYSNPEYIKDFYFLISYDPISRISQYSENIDTENNIPHFDKAFEDFHKKFLHVANNRKSGLVNISIRNPSPEKANFWLNQIILSLNNYSRQDDIRDSRASLDFLYNQIKANEVIEIEKVLAKLIERKIQSLMMAEIDQEYLYEVIDQPSFPIYRFFPNRTKISIQGSIVGILISLLVSFIAASKGITAIKLIRNQFNKSKK